MNALQEAELAVTVARLELETALIDRDPDLIAAARRQLGRARERCHELGRQVAEESAEALAAEAIAAIEAARFPTSYLVRPFA